MLSLVELLLRDLDTELLFGADCTASLYSRREIGCIYDLRADGWTSLILRVATNTVFLNDAMNDSIIL